MLTEGGAYVVANALKDAIAEMQLELNDGTILTQSATTSDINTSYDDNTQYFDVSATFDFTDYQDKSLVTYKLNNALGNTLIQTSVNVSLSGKTTEEVIVRVKVAFTGGGFGGA